MGLHVDYNIVILWQRDNIMHSTLYSRRQPVFIRFITRESYGNSVLVSWCLSQPGTDRSPGEIENSGFHHMID